MAAYEVAPLFATSDVEAEHEVEHAVWVQVEVADERLQVLDHLGRRLAPARACVLMRRWQLRELGNEL